MRRGVLGVIGASVIDAEKVRCTKKSILFEPRPADFRRRVTGCQIRAVDRIGKRVVLRLSSSDSIVLEPRMTGLVLVADPPSKEHLRFRLCLRGGKHDQLLYWDRRGLGSVRLLTEEQFADVFSPQRIGPDALKITSEQLHRSLARAAVRSRLRCWISV